MTMSSRPPVSPALQPRLLIHTSRCERVGLAVVAISAAPSPCRQMSMHHARTVCRRAYYQVGLSWLRVSESARTTRTNEFRTQRPNQGMYHPPLLLLLW